MRMKTPGHSYIFSLRRASVKTAMLIAVLAAMGGSVAACTSPWAESDPVGIGIGTDAFKKSPCACLNLPQKAPDAKFWRRMRG